MHGQLKIFQLRSNRQACAAAPGPPAPNKLIDDQSIDLDKLHSIVIDRSCMHAIHHIQVFFYPGAPTPPGARGLGSFKK